MMLFKDKYGTHYECDFDMSNVDSLVLSGGALKCIYFLGALSRVTRHLSNIKYYGGTSCGSMVTTMLAVGYTPIQIFKRIYTERVSFYNITKTLDISVDIMSTMIEEKGFQRDISFKRFKELTGKRLAFVTSNVSRLREEIFCDITHPDIPILTAVRLSCSLPVIFPVSRFNNDIFIDGIFFDNFPIKVIKLFEQHKSVLCISTSTSHYDKRINEFYRQPDVYKIVLIPDSYRKFFCMTKVDKFCMYSVGYNYIHDHILCHRRTRHRRPSV